MDCGKHNNQSSKDNKAMTQFGKGGYDVIGLTITYTICVQNSRNSCDRIPCVGDWEPGHANATINFKMNLVEEAVATKKSWQYAMFGSGKLNVARQADTIRGPVLNLEPACQEAKGTVQKKKKMRRPQQHNLVDKAISIVDNQRSRTVVLGWHQQLGEEYQVEIKVIVGGGIVCPQNRVRPKKGGLPLPGAGGDIRI